MAEPGPKPVPIRKVPCEVYSRVVGYLRPVQNWNLGRQQEFRDRVVFNVSNTIIQGERNGHETVTKGNSTTC